MMSPSLRSDIHYGAEPNKCRNYRYRLWRIWSNSPKVLFVMLNPSTADGEKDDPTIQKCMRSAQRWKFGGMYVGNLFAYRTSSPKELKSAENPVGKRNDWHLTEMADLCQKVILGWGNHGSYLNRNKEVLDLFNSPQCLGLTQQNQPKHPLYLPVDLLPRPVSPPIIY